MKVRFTSCDEHQARFGCLYADHSVLEEGKVYELFYEEVHNWHTEYWIITAYGDHLGPFNSVCFDIVESE